MSRIELPLDAGVAELLKAPGLPQARALLLDGSGRILVAVDGDGSPYANERLLHPYEDETVVQAARTDRSGLHERVDGNRSLWVIYIHLPELDWTYVSELFAWGKREPQSRPR